MLAISFQNLIPQTSDFGQSNKSVYSIRHGPPSQRQKQVSKTSVQV